ncbi:MAG TPA: cyclic peptide export ABC transporter [Longimicrobium sp.]|nr:cyclic peptide export ABC transporter [Longimicrobium sp.]
MKILTLLFRQSPAVVALSVLAGVASGACNALLLALANTALHTAHPWTEPRLLWGFTALALLLPGTRALSAYLLTTLGQRTVVELRNSLSARMLQAPLRELEELGSPRLLAALTQDVANVVAATTAIPLLSVQAAIVLGCLAYLAWLSPLAFGAVLVALAIGVVTYQVPVNRSNQLLRAGRELADHLYDHFRAITGGIKELKLHAPRQQTLLRQLDGTGRTLTGITVRTQTLFSAAAGWGQMVIFGLIGVTVFLLPALMPVSSAALTGYALILLYMMTPLELLLETIPTLAQAQVAFGKIEKLGLDLGAAPAALPAAPAGAERWTRVELRGATHAYHREGEDQPFTLGPIDLALTPGEIVFVVGGNGSGKTTLAKLMTGLYAPESGDVRVDGVPVTAATRDAYMQRWAVVFSDFFLFDSLLGIDTEGRDEAAAAYLRRLQLDHKVRVEGGRLSTTALSQGQRKRLALLTAYLEDRPIYLFDEWAADQDPVFKKVFYLELLPELRARGKTVVVISHDDHFFGVADRVLKLDYGRLEYDGPPEGMHSAPEPAAPPALRIAPVAAPERGETNEMLEAVAALAPA